MPNKMLRSTRKNAVIGATGVNSDTNVRKNGTLNSPHQHNNHGAKYKTATNDMAQILTTMNITVLSHLATVFTTALVVIMISSMVADRDNMETNFKLPKNVGRKTKHSGNNERLLRLGAQDIVLEREVISSLYYDIVVVGAGPAGLSASLFSARTGLQVLVVGSETGLLSEATSLDNFPSWYDVFSYPTSETSNTFSSGGIFWLETAKLQAAAAGVRFALPGLMVSKVTQSSNELFSLNISGRVVESMAVILATGATGRKLQLPKEESLWGKSIHSCAICDGPSYKNKTVVVVGGGDAAIDAATLLSRHARSVVLIHRRDAFRASNKQNLKAMFASHLTTVKTPFVVTEYLLNKNTMTLSGVRIQNSITNESDTLVCDGVFIMIGSTPNTQFLQDFVEMDEEGYIENQIDIFDTSTGTSKAGVFAAGEVSDRQYKQAITAAAAGARAAIDAERWLRKQLPYMASYQRILPETIPLQSFSDEPPSIDHEQTGLVYASERNLELQCNDFTQVDCVKAVTLQFPVVMFSKPMCPYCKQAIEVLTTDGAIMDAILVINIEGLNEEAIRTNLDSMTGRRTVPNIFIGGENIGGVVLLNRLQRLGELHPILENANATKEASNREVENFKADYTKVSKPGRDIECNDFRRTYCIEAVVHKYPVVIFSKSWCPYCKKALEALALEGVRGLPSMLVVNLDELEAQIIQSNLVLMTGRRTVPNIFIGGHTIGGGDETVQLQRSGALRSLLVRAKAIALN